jgi:hypothetical protein
MMESRWLRVLTHHLPQLPALRLPQPLDQSLCCAKRKNLNSGSALTTSQMRLYLVRTAAQLVSKPMNNLALAAQKATWISAVYEHFLPPTIVRTGEVVRYIFRCKECVNFLTMHLASHFSLFFQTSINHCLSGSARREYKQSETSRQSMHAARFCRGPTIICICPRINVSACDPSHEGGAVGCTAPSPLCNR